MSDPAEPAIERPYPDYTQRYNVLAVLAFVLVWLTIIGGIVLGYIALHQIKRTGELGRGWALAAVILGWIGLALTVLVIVIGVALGWFAVAQGS